MVVTPSSPLTSQTNFDQSKFALTSSPIFPKNVKSVPDKVIVLFSASKVPLVMVFVACIGPTVRENPSILSFSLSNETSEPSKNIEAVVIPTAGSVGSDTEVTSSAKISDFLIVIESMVSLLSTDKRMVPLFRVFPPMVIVSSTRSIPVRRSPISTPASWPSSKTEMVPFPSVTLSVS